MWRDLKVSIAAAMTPDNLRPAGLHPDEPGQAVMDLLAEVDEIDEDSAGAAFLRAYGALYTGDVAHGGEGIDFDNAMRFLSSLAPAVIPGYAYNGEAPSPFMKNFAAKVVLDTLAEAAIAYPDDGPGDGGYYADVRDRWVRHFVAVHAAA